MAFSIYCWVNVPVEDAPNLLLRVALAAAVRSHGGPWICGGDWNAEPHELERAGWLTALGGHGWWQLLLPHSPRVDSSTTSWSTSASRTL